MHYAMQVSSLVRIEAERRTEIFILSSKAYGLQTGKGRTLACLPKTMWTIDEGYTCGSR